MKNQPRNHNSEKLSNSLPKKTSQGSGRAERFPSVPSTRPETLLPLSLVNSTFSLDRPGAVQGREAAKRTLDSEDRSGIIQREEKGGTAGMESTTERLHKGTVLQRSGPGRVFKGLGVAKRYCKTHWFCNTVSQC